MIRATSEDSVQMTALQLRDRLSRRMGMPCSLATAYWVIHVLKHAGVAHRTGYTQVKPVGRPQAVWTVPASVELEFAGEDPEDE